ncbi:MAG TPA: hypothetical protein VGM64_06740 [Lacunisphaera sp.]|jgi:hypothetical protein
MRLFKTFLFPVVSSLLTVAASAALPIFSPQTIALPPLTLKENAKASLHPFEGHAPAASAPVIVPERQIVSLDKFIITPRGGIDYKLLIKHPDPDVDYKLIVKQVGAQDGK